MCNQEQKWKITNFPELQEKLPVEIQPRAISGNFHRCKNSEHLVDIRSYLKTLSLIHLLRYMYKLQYSAFSNKII